MAEKAKKAKGQPGAKSEMECSCGCGCIPPLRTI